MVKRSLCVAMVIVCAAALFGPGCRSKKSVIGEGDQQPPEITGQKPVNGGELAPRHDGPLGERLDVKLENVQFDYDSFQVKDSETAKIQKAAEFMKAEGKVCSVVEGNCDERGSREYNLTLSEQRALAVRAYLVGLGIDGQRIQTKSWGKRSLWIQDTTKQLGRSTGALSLPCIAPANSRVVCVN